jgi:hypothetical protein
MRRIASILLIAFAVIWGAIVAYQAREYRDGPPMGAICSAIPAVLLLIGGGVVWPKSKGNH